MVATSATETLVTEPKRYSCSREALCPARPVIRTPPAQAAVEQQRQGDVAAGVAALADDLDPDRTEDRDRDRDPGGRGAGQQAERDAGHRDVARGRRPAAPAGAAPGRCRWPGPRVR